MKLPRYPKYKDSGVKLLGRIPEHWEMSPFKHEVDFQEGPGIMADDFRDDGIPLLRVAGVQSGWASLEGCNYLDPVQVSRKWNHFRLLDGDLLVSASATMGTVCEIGHNTSGAVPYTGLIRLRGKSGKVEKQFLRNFAVSNTFSTQIDLLKAGATIQHYGPSHLRRVFMVKPPLDEQLQIGKYLKLEAEKIDALIAKQQHLIELLYEKRQAIIAHAVTKGIDADAPMKPSGIDWIGEVPAHWEVERSRWLLTERDQRSKTGEEEMLTVSHLTGVTPRSEKNVTMFEAETNEGYKLCYAGDLVINTLWAWMGAMGIAPIFGMVSPAYNVYIPGKRLWPNYIDLLVRMPLFVQEITRYSKGVWTSRLRLYPEGLYQAYFPVPPLDEQKAIAQYIANENARIESLMVAANKAIELLQERRSTLISNAVTGQIDVRNYKLQEAPAVCL